MATQGTAALRAAYLDYFRARGHALIPGASLVPREDPTTLFTGSGMQPLIPYLLGQAHPAGSRLMDSQPCFRAEDIDEVGDTRHTTFFEMLGNWALGSYFKEEQLPWLFSFLTGTWVSIRPVFRHRVLRGAPLGNPAGRRVGPDLEELFTGAGVTATTKEIGTSEIAARTGLGNARIAFYDESNCW